MAWTKRSGIMLCQPLDERNLERNFREAASLMCQPKLDGMRCWIDWVGEEPILTSSEGHPIEGVPHLSVFLKGWCRSMGWFPQFDGELYRHEWDFEKIIGTAKRKLENRTSDYEGLQFHIFDYKGDAPNATRNKNLWDAFTKLPKEAKPYILKVRTDKASSTRDVDNFLDTYIREGYEGIIVRNPFAPYVEKRPWWILKWKPAKEDIYQIVEVKEAIAGNGRPLGWVGSFVCRDRFDNLFSAGPGANIKRIDSINLWKQREALPGRFVKVSYQNLTKAGVPRFGKFSLTITDKPEEHADAY